MKTLEINKPYVFFVLPGWLFGGTIAAIEGGDIILKDAIFLEGVNAGHATVTDLPLAQTSLEQNKVMRTFWALPDATTLAVEHIGFFIPSACSFVDLHAADMAKVGHRATWSRYPQKV